MLLIVVAALVAVMTWLGLTGKFGQVNISTTLTTPILTMFWPTIIPTLSLTLTPSLIPQKCLTPMPLLQLDEDDVKYRDQFCRSGLLYEGWSIVGALSSKNAKGRAHLHKIVLGAYNYHQSLQAKYGSNVD